MLHLPNANPGKETQVFGFCAFHSWHRDFKEKELCFHLLQWFSSFSVHQNYLGREPKICVPQAGVRYVIINSSSIQGKKDFPNKMELLSHMENLRAWWFAYVSWVNLIWYVWAAVYSIKPNRKPHIYFTFNLTNIFRTFPRCWRPIPPKKPALERINKNHKSSICTSTQIRELKWKGGENMKDEHVCIALATLKALYWNTGDIGYWHWGF